MSPEYAQLYDPRSALSHAQIALQLSKDTKHAGKSDVPAIFETLAMAWAVNGNIDEAVSAAARAMELYRVKGLAAQTGKMANLIEYLKKQK